GFEIVEGPYGVPDFGARGRIAAARPVPALTALQAVMKALRLAELNRIEHERHVPMLAEPARIGLIGGVDFALGVPAQVQDRRQLSGHLGGTIDVADDVRPGDALE